MSFHHWMYCGCQCSSARWRRLLPERPTLLGIFSAEIMASRSIEVELRPRLGPVGGQRALWTYGVGALENPVLPRGQPAEDLRFHRFGTREAEVGFHSGERIRRQSGAPFDRQPHLVVPVELVGGERHEPRIERRLG